MGTHGGGRKTVHDLRFLPRHLQALSRLDTDRTSNQMEKLDRRQRLQPCRRLGYQGTWEPLEDGYYGQLFMICIFVYYGNSDLPVWIVWFILTTHQPVLLSPRSGTLLDGALVTFSDVEVASFFIILVADSFGLDLVHNASIF